MSAVSTTATAAAEPTLPVLKARLYASKAGNVVLVPGPPRVVMYTRSNVFNAATTVRVRATAI
jgi:hypothetical protein